jgi:hypothetical protein
MPVVIFNCPSFPLPGKTFQTRLSSCTAFHIGVLYLVGPAAEPCPSVLRGNRYTPFQSQPRPHAVTSSSPPHHRPYPPIRLPKMSLSCRGELMRDGGPWGSPLSLDEGIPGIIRFWLRPPTVPPLPCRLSSPLQSATEKRSSALDSSLPSPNPDTPQSLPRALSSLLSFLRAPFSSSFPCSLAYQHEP